MDKITEIKTFTKRTTTEVETQNENKTTSEIEVSKKATNPIKNSDNQVLKNLSKFTNSDISKKFNINDLLR